MDTIEQSNRLVLSCLQHGEYQKFITELDTRCPYCKQDEEIKKNKMPESNKKAVLEIKNIVINCEIHGLKEYQVPAWLAQNVGCDQCDALKDQKQIKDEITELLSNTCITSGVPEKFMPMLFEGLDHSKSHKQPLIVGRIIQYVRDVLADGEPTNHKNIIFSGNMGTGKTTYMALMMKSIIMRSLEDGVKVVGDIKTKGRLACLMITEADLKNAIIASWKKDSKESTQQLMQRLANKPMLFIDDVGVSNTHESLLEFYNQLIDERYKNKLPTYITTNLSHEQIKLAIGARAAERFIEKNRCIVFNADWQSYRTPSADEIEMF